MRKNNFGWETILNYIVSDIYLPPWASIITIWNNRIQNGRRIGKKVYYGILRRDWIVAIKMVVKTWMTFFSDFFRENVFIWQRRFFVLYIRATLKYSKKSNKHNCGHFSYYLCGHKQCISLHFFKIQRSFDGYLAIMVVYCKSVRLFKKKVSFNCFESVLPVIRHDYVYT